MNMLGRTMTLRDFHEPVERVIQQIEKFIDPPREPSRTSFD